MPKECAPSPTRPPRRPDPRGDRVDVCDVPHNVHTPAAAAAAPAAPALPSQRGGEEGGRGLNDVEENRIAERAASAVELLSTLWVWYVRGVGQDHIKPVARPRLLSDGGGAT